MSHVTGIGASTSSNFIGIGFSVAVATTIGIFGVALSGCSTGYVASETLSFVFLVSVRHDRRSVAVVAVLKGRRGG